MPPMAVRSVGPVSDGKERSEIDVLAVVSFGSELEEIVTLNPPRLALLHSCILRMGALTRPIRYRWVVPDDFEGGLEVALEEFGAAAGAPEVDFGVVGALGP